MFVFRSENTQIQGHWARLIFIPSEIKEKITKIASESIGKNSKLR